MRWASRTAVSPSRLPRSSVNQGEVIGSTRFMNIDRVNRRVEIGSTWIAPAWHRTAINTEAKYLMLRHALEIWQCIRVELKTDALNRRSRNAILRIGAKERQTAQTPDHLDGPRARHRLLQYPGLSWIPHGRR